MDQHESMPDSVKAGNDNPLAVASATPNSQETQIAAGLPPVPAGEPGPEDNRSWLAQNFSSLLFVAAIIAILVYFDVNLLFVAKAAIGLSLVIFIHEFGHFIVAKWCDVNVTTFSIGFGPPIPGCSYQWGETTYKIALFPLGGYVQMVGQVDGDESSDGNEDDPRSYRNKSVFQRMAIISAGVIMNAVLALVCFVVVFQGPGKDRLSPVVGLVDTGGPGFRVGLSDGDEFTLIGTQKHPYFEHIKTQVMATLPDQKIAITVRKPDGSVLNADILPRKSGDDPTPVIGFTFANRLQFRARSNFDASFTSPAYPGSPAAAAGFQFDDRIIGTTDPDYHEKVTLLRDDPRYPDHGQCDYFEFAHRMQRLAGKEVEILVTRKKGKATENAKVKVAPAYHWSLGVVMKMGEITAIRDDSPAASAKLKVRVSDKQKNTGDVIFGVSFRNKAEKEVIFGEAFEIKDGSKVVRQGQLLDPLRLPDQLRQAMSDLPAEFKKVTLYITRPQESGHETKDVSIKLDWDSDWTFDNPRPLSSSSPWAIPELGLAYLVKTTVANQIDGNKVRERTAGLVDYLVTSVTPDAGNPLEKDDVIKEVQIVSENGKEGLQENPWSVIESDEQWAFYYYALFGNGLGQSIKYVNVKVKRNDKDPLKTFHLIPVKDEAWPMIDRGWLFMPDQRRQKATGLGDAIELGLQDTHNNMVQVFQNLRGMILGRLSYKLTAGPLSIGKLAYRFAGLDWSELVFFLGLISVNLAVINFLPIPVLDGGHMVFLIYEMIRGKPASEAVRAWATYAGLALILSLMIAVTFLDLTRFFW